MRYVRATPPSPAGTPLLGRLSHPGLPGQQARSSLVRPTRCRKCMRSRGTGGSSAPRGCRDGPSRDGDLATWGWVVSRRPRVCAAPLALTSGGTLLINVAGFRADARPEALMRLAAGTGLPIFVAVELPPTAHRQALRSIDDAAADMAGRLGGRISAKASGRSSAAPAQAGRDRARAQAQRPRGRPRAP